MSTLTETVHQRIDRVFRDVGATGFVYAREVGVIGGPEVSVRGDEPVVLASVFKILVLTAFVRAVAAGDIDPAERVVVTARHRIGGVGFAGFSDDVEASWRDLALNMMALSDNAATDVVYHRVGGSAVDHVVAELGLSNTRVIGCCEDLFATILADLGAAPGADIDQVMSDATPEQLLATRAMDPLRTTRSTPRDTANLLDALWTDTAAPAPAAAQARNIMAQQIWPHRLASGFASGVVIAAKTGTLEPWRNEAGVVTYPDGRQYIAAVFTRADSTDDHLPAVDAAIGIAGRIAVEHVRVRSAVRAAAPQEEWTGQGGSVCG